jgi:hypothetical protein
MDFVEIDDAISFAASKPNIEISCLPLPASRSKWLRDPHGHARQIPRGVRVLKNVLAIRAMPPHLQTTPRTFGKMDQR